MSANYKLFSDVTTDLPSDYYKDNDIGLLQLSYEVDGKAYTADDISASEFYAKMRSGAPTKTSQINPEKAEECFEVALKAGFDIVHLAFSSGLSGSYNSCRIAAENLKEKYPDRTIYVVDSLCASLGEGLLLDYAVKKRNEGLSAIELANWLEDNKLHLCHMFTVDDLKYLHRGGRVSKTAAIAGAILGIKPVLHVDNEGHLVPIAKVRGRKTSLNALVEKMGERIDGYVNDTIAICHGDCIDDAKYVADLVKSKYGYKTCIINYTGKVIGSHSGPGTLALFFMGKER